MNWFCDDPFIPLQTILTPVQCWWPSRSWWVKPMPILSRKKRPLISLPTEACWKTWLFTSQKYSTFWAWYPLQNRSDLAAQRHPDKLPMYVNVYHEWCKKWEEFYSTNSNLFQTEEVVMPYLEVLATFRDSVRKEARALKATPILKECDKIRDDVLPNLGVRYRITLSQFWCDEWQWGGWGVVRGSRVP